MNQAPKPSTSPEDQRSLERTAMAAAACMAITAVALIPSSVSKLLDRPFHRSGQAHSMQVDENLRHAEGYRDLTVPGQEGVHLTPVVLDEKQKH